MEYEKLLGAAIRLVSFRPRTEKELRDFCEKTLKRHHTTAPLVIDRVLERLADFGYLDDAKFASWWLEQRTGRKPKGQRLIVRELQQKGISQDVIDALFVSGQYIRGRDAIDNISGERARARRAVERKLIIWKNLQVREKQKKISEFLYRRGFDWDTISGVVDDVLEKE